MNQFADEHGWARAVVDGKDVSPALSDEPLMGGRRKYVAWGKWRGRPAERFLWINPKANEIGTQTWIEHVALPGRLPDMTLTSMGMATSRVPVLAEMTTSSMAFRDRWAIWASDTDFVSSFFTPEMIGVLMAPEAPRVKLSIRGDSLFTSRTAWGRHDRGAAKRLDFLTRVADCVPRQVYSRYTDLPPGDSTR